MKIYTRTGDSGETSLFTGQRVKKNDPFMEAIGAVDTCNSAIGVAISHLPSGDNLKETLIQLQTIQHALFDLGAALATPRSSGVDKKLAKTRFDNEEIKALEKWMDIYDEQLSPLKAFILPGGHPAGAHLHLARTLCRSAERLVVPLYDRHDVDANVLMYLNRLSDYLFIASRFINHKLNCSETKWEQHKLAHTS